MHDRVSVASSEFIRNVGYWQNEALRRPVGITHHGRERLVLATPEKYKASQGAGEGHLTNGQFDAQIVLDNLEDGYVALNGSLRVAHANAAAATLIGRARDMMIGDGLGEVFPQPFAAILQEKLLRVMRARKPDAFAATLNDTVVSIRAFPLSEGVGVLLGNRTEQHDQRVALGVGTAACDAANRHSHAAGV
jgi:PAS domain-containing protein